jgi:PAS domain S-box-containing protein
LPGAAMTTLRAKFEKEFLLNKNPIITELLLDRFMNLSSEFMCITTLEEGQIIFVNHTFLDRVGYDKEHVLDSSVVCLNLWENPNNRDSFIKLLLKNGSVEDFEQNFRDKHGRIVTYILSAEIITLFGVSCILTFGRDVSKKTSLEEFHHIQMVEELRQTVQALNGLIIKMKLREDGQLVYVLAEGKIAEEVGYTTANSYGKTVDELFPGLMEIEGSYFNQALQGQVVSFEIELGQRMLLKTLYPYREHNRITGILVSAVDITERKNLERLLQISELNSALGQLAAGAAHEIRNPLTSIQGFVQLLGEMTEKHGLIKGKEYVNLILTELTRINHLVTEMLWLQKPKEDKQELFNVLTLINEILPLIKMEANLKSIQVITDLDLEIMNIEAKPNLLKQVLLNLCKNGIEAMNEGGSLHISVFLEDDWISICIKDTGPGIPVEIEQQIFNPFFTTKPNGNGLGLFISRQIIYETGGTLSLTSDSSGTTACIKFKSYCKFY